MPAMARMLIPTAMLMAATLCHADDPREAKPVTPRGTAAEPIVDDDMVVSPETFVRDLKLDKPELAAVRAALEDGDIEQAGRAYISHFRTKDMASDLYVDWPGRSRDPGYNTSRADGLMAGSLWDGYNVYEVPETGIDWREGPLPCITRFPVLGTMRHAMFHTRDAGYARWAVDHILEYIDNWPIEEFIDKGTQGWVNDVTVCRPWHWCMHPQRVSQVGETLVLVREFPEVSDDELLGILHRMYQETVWIRLHMKEWVDRRHNGGLGMISGMAHACKMFEDFQASEHWAEYNVDMVTQYINESFYPDGQCIEMTCAYSQSVASQTQQMAHMLRHRESMQRAIPLLKAMVDWAIGLRRPTGRLPAFGDLYPSGFGSAIYAPMLDWIDIPYAKATLAGEETPEPPFLDWPSPGSEVYAGRYAMRSDWSKDALYLCLHAGPFGISHAHGDKLTFVLTAHGADFVIDPSSTKYRNNEPGAYISQQQAGFLHNVITVNGVDPHLNGPIEVTEPLDNPWEHGLHYVYVAGDYSFAPAAEAEWQRRIVFVDRSYWILQDVIKPDGPSAHIEQNFQFEKDTEIEIDGDRTICTAPNGARLVLIPLEGGLEPAVSIGDTSTHVTYWSRGKQTEWHHSRGWTGRSSNALMPAPAVTYSGDVAMPATITVAMVPIAPGGDPTALPRITSRADEGKTVWSLPHSSGTVVMSTDIDACDLSEL